MSGPLVVVPITYKRYSFKLSLAAFGPEDFRLRKTELLWVSLIDNFRAETTMGDKVLRYLAVEFRACSIRPTFTKNFGLKLCCVVFCFPVTYPLDVVRRRMQMKGISGDLFAYTSTRHAFSMIVQVEGIKGLYKGMWPNLLKVTPIACAIKS